MLTNKKMAELHRKNYDKWKTQSLKTKGYFVVFDSFLTNKKLSKISGNALKLYIYMGLNSNNNTGEMWHSIKTMANYFNRSERTISYWIKDLEKANLIKRMQLEQNGSSHTFLQTYL